MNRLTETFSRAPLHLKVIVISSLLLFVSMFLPWYQDVDAFHTGDQFLGITGPTSFIGLSILILAACSSLLSIYKMIGRKLVKLPWKESSFYAFVACQSFFLLAITNSIFLDIKFGVNITMKETLFGMSLALLTSVGLGVGVYLMKKFESTAASHNETGDLKPLISFKERSHTSMSGTYSAPSTQTQTSSPSLTSQEEDLVAQDPESQQMGF